MFDNVYCNCNSHARKHTEICLCHLCQQGQLSVRAQLEAGLWPSILRSSTWSHPLVILDTPKKPWFSIWITYIWDLLDTFRGYEHCWTRVPTIHYSLASISRPHSLSCPFLCASPSMGMVSKSLDRKVSSSKISTSEYIRAVSNSLVLVDDYRGPIDTSFIDWGYVCVIHELGNLHWLLWGNVPTGVPLLHYPSTYSTK